MAKRNRVIKVNTEAVMGKDSYAMVSKLTVTEMRAARKSKGDAFEDSVTLLKKHVLSWNWVDDDDAIMPSPAKKPSIVDTLTEDEVMILGAAILGVEYEVKN